MIGAVCAAAALLLMLSGGAKLRTPGPTVDMLVSLQRRVFLRRSALAPVPAVIGSIEIIVGVVVLINGSRIAIAALAACYLAFTVVAVMLARSDKDVSCGCFGKAGAPVGLSHVAVDVIAFIVAVAGVVDPFGSLGGYAGQSLLVQIAGLFQAALLAALAYGAITALPTVSALRREGMRP